MVEAPFAASRAASWSNSVDLPIPGSPPNNTIEPGTNPPPRTRSTSGMPQVSRWASALDTAAMAVMPAATAAAAVGRALLARIRGASIVSTSEFHAPHAGHWPAQRGVDEAHC
jgi:hypothetical protein